MRSAHAADTLTAVTPPTDWTAVVVLVVAFAVIVGVIAYIQYLKRPGLQRGEEAFNKLYELLGQAHETIKQQAVALEAHAGKAVQPSVELTAEPGAPLQPIQPATKFPWPDN